jgi:hypothetical protein
MKRIYLIISLLLPVVINAQVGRLPYQTVRQTYRGDTLDTKLNNDTVEHITNLNAYSFDKPIVVRDTGLIDLIKVHGGGGSTADNLLEKTLTISSANILSGGSFEILPAPGTDTTIIVTNVIFTYLSDGTVYSASNNNDLRVYTFLGTDTVNIAYLDFTSLTQTTDFDSYISVSALAVSKCKPIELKIPNQYTAGTSTAELTIYYKKKKR